MAEHAWGEQDQGVGGGGDGPVFRNAPFRTVVGQDDEVHGRVIGMQGNAAQTVLRGLEIG